MSDKSTNVELENVVHLHPEKTVGIKRIDFYFGPILTTVAFVFLFIFFQPKTPDFSPLQNQLDGLQHQIVDQQNKINTQNETIAIQSERLDVANNKIKELKQGSKELQHDIDAVITGSNNIAKDVNRLQSDFINSRDHTRARLKALEVKVEKLGQEFVGVRDTLRNLVEEVSRLAMEQNCLKCAMNYCYVCCKYCHDRCVQFYERCNHHGCSSCKVK